MHESGDIYFGEYGGLYCFGCECFYLERDLVDGLCPDHKTAPTYLKEENYFFRMSKYQDWLIDYIQTHPDWIRPERYKNEMLAFLKEPLEDLCISRPKSRMDWGITLPFDDRYVTYVWFDALINYLSGLGYPGGEAYEKFWPAQHLIAKDILKPHAIYWPTMLKAMGVAPFTNLNVHGYWQMAAGKMSKSLGNVVEPRTLAARFGVDQVRYFFLREMVFGLDAHFSEAALTTRINADLANDLGNLFARSLGMAFKYRQGVVPPPGDLRHPGSGSRHRGSGHGRGLPPPVPGHGVWPGPGASLGSNRPPQPLHRGRGSLGTGQTAGGRRPAGYGPVPPAGRTALDRGAAPAGHAPERREDERATGPGPGPVGSTL